MHRWCLSPVTGKTARHSITLRSISVQADGNLLLEADALGLGAVWMGVAPLKEQMETVRNLLNLPEELELLLSFPVDIPPGKDTGRPL